MTRLLLEVGDYVRQRNTLTPIGIIERIEGEFARVRFGVADGKTFRDDFNLTDLKRVTDRIYSPDEVQKRQAEEAGGKLVAE